ncbi:methyltransferase family protein [Alkalicoccobacillus porphyridii]|uniref:Isoprenylcysteine carboxylmethyltransferase family protein n=1 Tax=Alkalicoccobacillus porphyridii TaxID=2597270 RepID=A0A554A061_9BACI|nr:isoprenylcysteine carboxylmethyltransferase family protein [Alkalicoccobacillus porphyridii]TSB47063.1 isoprenylcysteine carboxylmethyltransferase family protein [Alkalicoccobacillus porphyridii]
MSFNEWLFLILSIVWLMEFLIFKGQRESEKSHSSERKSYYLILFAITITVMASLSFRELSFFTIENASFTWLSLFIYGVGIFLRYWSMLTLKQQFTRHVEVSADKKLVSHGPYRYMRHPLYTALFVIMIGLSSYLASWTGLLITLILVLPALLFRIKLEEGMLTEALGKNYDEWKQQRWILVPWIY